ncbi:DUF3299 domain-containing protein [Lignipirellula cremea]|uniref:DUF4190 domain-containing protein n=1 Tax=Lignipirellula cremea TaxID=2528010 RepID=A0A518DQN8_9BACT|nr:DUF3299 domain-containing protein [Lignipirellula cremea]QDU94155.1 hypothetical protein Pla8534_19430 [Lignipirellula cremea]
MDTQTTEPENENYYSYNSEEEYVQPYRTLSKPALVALIVGLLSTAALLSPQLLFVPVIGLVLGVASLMSIRAHREELTGAPLAWAGVLLSAGLFLASGITHTVIYYTEVPEGYQRVSFSLLKPGPEDTSRGLPVSSEAVGLNGTNVFIAGYVHPGVSGQGRVKKFVLVPDMGTCCFGGQPDLTDMIEVTIENDQAIQYSTRRRKLAGVFHVTPQTKKAAGGLEGGCFKLDCDLVK